MILLKTASIGAVLQLVGHVIAPVTLTVIPESTAIPDSVQEGGVALIDLWHSAQEGFFRPSLPETYGPIALEWSNFLQEKGEGIIREYYWRAFPDGTWKNKHNGMFKFINLAQKTAYGNYRYDTKKYEFKKVVALLLIKTFADEQQALKRAWKVMQASEEMRAREEMQARGKMKATLASQASLRERLVKEAKKEEEAAKRKELARQAELLERKEWGKLLTLGMDAGPSNA
ncbi:uncharacterized protein UTRI_03320 [Ustilago trichophora]|uniref:Uncharacterized protein n=1 Tax=Ustilago trichophora TaxID=86804 RepID=A0A5C3E793_9BASI|nr:uncharacterized protein UTRI_03320 [Ustilago trichophora]